jgi:hypothetical protein
MVMVVTVMVNGEAHTAFKANGNGAICQFAYQKRTVLQFPVLFTPDFLVSRWAVG